MPYRGLTAKWWIDCLGNYHVTEMFVSEFPRIARRGLVFLFPTKNQVGPVLEFSFAWPHYSTPARALLTKRRKRRTDTSTYIDDISHAANQTQRKVMRIIYSLFILRVKILKYYIGICTATIISLIFLITLMNVQFYVSVKLGV